MTAFNAITDLSSEPNIYLVTGCCGFIGTAFCLDVLQSGKSVIGVDNFTDFYPLKLKLENLSELQAYQGFRLLELDIRNPSAMQWLGQLTFDCVVHLAGQPGVRESITDPKGYFTNNVVGTYNLMNGMFFGGKRKFLFASSSSIYSDQNETPFHEDDNQLCPASPYGVTKMLGEQMLKMGCLFGLDSLALRFFSVYGPRQRPDLLIPRIFEAAVNHKPIPIYGDGGSLRDFTYIGDIVKGIRRGATFLMQNTQVSEIINVGSERPVSVNTVLNLCEKVMGMEVKKEYKPALYYENKVTWAHRGKVNLLLGFQPDYDLEQGLKAHWNWMVKTNRVPQ